ncbi:hypothetical protein AAEX63_10325 [Luteococcus sp. H138]|uniref:hypothetical protein n=1 Tax=unclassified Luteococcus TaxID=2639923 RepID=UPI00313B1B18
MSMSASAARLRPVAVAAALALGLGMSGCANYETLEPYQPAAGVQTDAAGVKVRNLMVVSDGGSMHLAGTLIANAEDSLTKVSGTALKANGDQAGPLTIAAPAVKLPAAQNVNLADSKMVVKGDVKAGGMTQISLTFGKAAPLTLTVPVLDAKSAGLTTPKA